MNHWSQIYRSGANTQTDGQTTCRQTCKLRPSPVCLCGIVRMPMKPPRQRTSTAAEHQTSKQIQRKLFLSERCDPPLLRALGLWDRGAKCRHYCNGIEEGTNCTLLLELKSRALVIFSPPPPPPPSTPNQLKTWVLGTFFSDRNEFSPHLWCISKSVQSPCVFHAYSMFIILKIPMTHCSFSAYLCSPVQPPPHVKREDVIDVLLFFEGKRKAHQMEETRSIQRCARSIFHAVVERTNGNAVRVCHRGAGNSSARARSTLSAT